MRRSTAIRSGCGRRAGSASIMKSFSTKRRCRLLQRQFDQANPNDRGRDRGQRRDCSQNNQVRRTTNSVWEALACRFTPAGFSCSTAFSPLYWLQSLLRGESDVASGTVKWFNGQKGYGFIAPDTGGKDVFVHISAVEKAGLDGLPDGAKVTFDIVPNRGKESAENLRVK